MWDAAAAAVLRGRSGEWGGTEPFELMVPIGVHTHLLAFPTVARRWLGERFGAPPAAPVGPAARTDAHDGVEHGLLMSP